MAASDRVHKNMVVTEATHTNEDHTHARTHTFLAVRHTGVRRAKVKMGACGKGLFPTCQRNLGDVSSLDT